MRPPANVLPSPPRSSSGEQALLAYVSGHGFGHFTRSALVLERLVGLRPGLAVHLRTSPPALRLAEEALCRPGSIFASVAQVDVGPGVVQRGPLAVDVAATRAALQQHVDAWETTVECEAAFARSIGAGLVFADAPPIAFAVAARAGLPSVALANFAWSWIYDGYAANDAWFGEAAERLRRAEATASLCLALPMGGGLDAFPIRRAIPTVVRHPGQPGEKVRARIGHAGGDARPLVLVSFGGFGDALDIGEAAAKNPDLAVAVVGRAPRAAPANLRAVEPGDDLSHADLVAAADCLVGKPGYGTVAECLFRPTPMVYVARGEFREYPALVDAIRRHLPSAELAPDDLRAGRWSAAVAAARASRPPEPLPPFEGSSAAAAAIAALLPARDFQT